MTKTEQRYHSNKQEFLALKWAVTEQFHEYLSPYGKNRNEFVVRTDSPTSSPRPIWMLLDKDG